MSFIVLLLFNFLYTGVQFFIYGCILIHGIICLLIGFRMNKINKKAESMITTIIGVIEVGIIGFIVLFFLFCMLYGIVTGQI